MHMYLGYFLFMSDYIVSHWQCIVILPTRLLDLSKNHIFAW